MNNIEDILNNKSLISVDFDDTIGPNSSKLLGIECIKENPFILTKLPKALFNRLNILRNRDSEKSMSSLVNCIKGFDRESITNQVKEKFYVYDSFLETIEFFKKNYNLSKINTNVITRSDTYQVKKILNKIKPNLFEISLAIKSVYGNEYLIDEYGLYTGEAKFNIVKNKAEIISDNLKQNTLLTQILISDKEDYKIYKDNKEIYVIRADKKHYKEDILNIPKDIKYLVQNQARWEKRSKYFNIKNPILLVEKTN